MTRSDAPASIGWPLLAVPDADGRLRWPDLDRSVRDRVQAILSTRPGEQLGRPEFGAGLQRFLHEPDTVDTRRRLHQTISGALVRWEPRIELLEVLVEDGASAGGLRITIRYRIRDTGALRSLGLTLKGEGA